MPALRTGRFSKSARSGAPPVLSVNNLRSTQVTISAEIGPTRLAARDIDVKVDSQTGLVQPGRGISVNADPAAVQKFGGAYKVESVPPELEIIQRGGNPNHYEIAPREPMTMQRYQELLNQVQLTPVK